jgi:hypothetical protein
VATWLPIVPRCVKGGAADRSKAINHPPVDNYNLKMAAKIGAFLIHDAGVTVGQNTDRDTVGQNTDSEW